MSQFVDQAAVPSICRPFCNVPVRELLLEYMDANKCIEELLKQLEEERRGVRREKLAVARLQREVARSKCKGTMREKLIHELEEERRLRLDSEKRLREVTEESELGRMQMVSLQQHFSRMEETVRTLLQNQGVLEQTAVDTVDIMKAYKDKLSEEVQKQRDSLEEESRLAVDKADLPADASETEEERSRTELLLERLRALEEENSALATENECQREQYERCLDEVANQVVQALLTQKDLREECLKLRTRVFDLEQQNRTMSVLFQQRVRPASDLLLQKLHSRIMDLSVADLLPERSKSFLLSRNTDSPPHDVQLNGKAGLPVSKCLSQLSLTAPLAAYPHSSYSSSELSLSSACSEYSSGSYTWNDGRSCGKMSSLTWEKRLSLGSSAPSNICAPLEEQFPTRRKESHILEGLRKLQRRKPKASSPSSTSKVSKSGYKDCMNSNEGIYSLGIKSGSKGISKPYAGRAAASTVGVKKFSYDSDDADDESPHSADCRGDSVPIKEGWVYCKKLSHSVSDSLCSWEGLQDTEPTAGNSDASTKQPPPYNYKERPEKLMSFINSFLSGGRTSAVLKPSLLHMEVSPTEPDFPPLQLSDTEPEDLHSEVVHPRPTPSRPSVARQPQKEPKRLSRDASTLLPAHCLRGEQGRTQSADGRPRPFSLIKERKGAKSQSEESIMAIFDADGEPIELNAQQSSIDSGSKADLSGSKAVAGYSELASQERPVKQKGVNLRNYTALESPEKPSECQSKAGRGNGSREGSAERLTTHSTPQRKLIKPPSNRANKVHSVPLMNDASGPKANSSKIPSRGKGSPLRVSKGSSAEPTSGPTTQEKSPSSPPVKMSRFIKTPCTQSTKTVGSKLPGRSDWGKASASSVPPSSTHTPSRLLDHVDYGEQPTRDQHYETSKTQLRSPSPPPPPGRTTSLLIRPNYDGSPQALKTGAQPSTPTTVRGPPPNYHPPPVPKMQHTLPYKGQDSVDLDAGYGTAIAPQKLVDKASQHLQKSPAVAQTPCKGTLTRTPPKHYLPASASGYVPDHPENAPKSSKNVPPYPHSTQKGSSLHSTFTSKKGSTNENGYPQLHKTSSSLPVSLQSQLLCTAEPQESLIQSSQPVVSPTSPLVAAPNQTEKALKTRIPMGFKAFVKSTASHKHGASAPGKQEKDHINSVSKETETSNASTQCERLPPPAYGIDPPPVTSITENKGEGRSSIQEAEPHTAALAEEGEACDKADRDGRLFSRSISVTTKPHLKPALGMNGAKARSQSFSTSYMEKPSVNAPDGPGKIRTQIITNSGERGNSLTRQSSFVEGLQAKPSAGSGESPIRCPSNRLSHYGGMTVSNSHQVLPEKAPKSGSKTEGKRDGGKGEIMMTPPQKEVRSLPLADRIGLRNSRRPAKVASHPQFESPSSPVYSPEAPAQGSGGKVLSLSKVEQSRVGKTQTCGSLGVPEEGDKQVSPVVSSIEEKVMMGIEENVQKGQGQEKILASEAKQKTGPSLANWFGLRKSKLPAPNGKKSDATKGKEEKKELKVGSVLGGKQMKSDRKKKNDSPSKESQDQTLCENGNKLSSIMDHCNIQMGQIANQIQCSTVYIGKDQFMKDLLGRRVVVKGDSLTTSLPGISIPQKHCGEMSGDMEIGRDTATIIVTQKINIRGANEEDPIPEATCQDHMIGSSCQMRTLDSGIGTFPLPDSVTRVNGRHIPKSESSPDRVASVPTEPDTDPPARSPPPHVKVPPPSESCPHAPSVPGHSLSDPTVTSSRAQEVQSRLPKPSTSDAIRTKRLSQMELRTDHAVTSPTDVQEKHAEKKRGTKEQNLPSDRALRVCTYSGSSSDTETETECEGNTLGSSQKTLRNPSKTSNSVDHNEATKRSSVRKSLSIMDYYPHNVFSHLEKGQHRSVSQYNLLLNEPSSEVKAGERLTKGNQLVKTSGSAEIQPGSLELSLESLNKLNLGSSTGLFPGTELGGSGVLRSEGGTGVGCRADEPPSSSSFSGKAGPDHVGGSLSDSLYDSFSSCTSQGSNDV